MKPVVLCLTACVSLALVGCGTQEASPVPTVTETMKVEVPVTPTECLDALEKANDALAVSGEVITMFQGAVQQAAAQDADGLEASLVDKKRLDTKLKQEMDSYRTYLKACKDL